jgi:hypothetical protein
MTSQPAAELGEHALHKYRRRVIASKVAAAPCDRSGVGSGRREASHELRAAGAEGLGS